MQAEPVFIVVDAVEHGQQFLAVELVAGEVANQDALQFAQSLTLLTVVLRVGVRVVFA